MKTMVSKEPISKEAYKAYHINRIKKLYDDLRGASKSCTFALQYAGTAHTLVVNSGFSKEDADQIYANYHAAYAHSKNYTNAKKAQACIDGYVNVAFGLKVRAPLLAKSLLGKSSTTSTAEAEARTVGNALSQSYGLLTNRALNAVMKRIWGSKFRHCILPVAMIHDAIYFLCKNEAEAVEFLNTVLIEEMSWQELPEIAHDTVKLEANLDLFYPDWAHPLELPNRATADEILSLCDQHVAKLKQ